MNKYPKVKEVTNSNMVIADLISKSNAEMLLVEKALTGLNLVVFAKSALCCCYFSLNVLKEFSNR